MVPGKTARQIDCDSAKLCPGNTRRLDPNEFEKRIAAAIIARLCCSATYALLGFYRFEYHLVS